MTRVWEVAVAAPARLGEGPTWDARAGRLIWVDILSARVHTVDPATGRRTVLATEQHVGAAKPRTRGGLVVNLRDGVGTYDADGAFAWLCREPVAGRRGNDAAVAPDGSLWAGTMAYDEAPGRGTLTRIAPDGGATRVLSDVTVSNGTGWSPDGRRMYYIDTPTRRVDVFDVTDDGLVTGRRPFVEIEEPAGTAGYPDGLAVDAEGGLWVAMFEGAQVRHYTPDGVLERVLPMPVARPTACAFGGAALTDLYVTTARGGPGVAPLGGSLLVVPDAGRGLAQPEFAG
ncbi:SMP-30/gluconolactonase/LRE family protein [Streptomyces albofaciens JCM 4342]|uniref:SMP-30/gluconolactonase/LRE family protein n=1 Tax=Streptomyces albofaciens TaxID=66866 RepID=UPI001238A383|nr:SMP-30/gluconolactonase/LRE family protein [Streptomyces albofaciens]KAA6223227.1 SMP-30/gluconolactonase/LRE family protein [Streptomyces albofaciens JCM 4342]